MSEFPPPFHIREEPTWSNATCLRFLSLLIKIQDWFDDLDYPNKLEAISEDAFNADRPNLFIAFDQKQNKLSIEERAFPLLRPPPPTVPNPKPGFISFIGETGSGKSWILRSLKRREDRATYPRPLVAPGHELNNFASTSADVNLYADSATSESANPILFLDFEGLEGSQPSSLKARLGNATPPSNEVESRRYAFIRDAYPRIAYAFSNCMIFVIDRQPGKAEHAAQLLTLYSNGSRQLGFKPALFLIFNKIHNSVLPSIEESTRRFLAMEGVTRMGLVDHYHKISVIHIPDLTQESSNLVLTQLDKLEDLLHEQHSEACKRRVAVRLDFTVDQITAYLTQALRVFTNGSDAVFDWSTTDAMSDCHKSSTSSNPSQLLTSLGHQDPRAGFNIMEASYLTEGPQPSHIPERPVNQEETTWNQEFSYLNYPNELEAIAEVEFNADRLNLFIAFDQKRNKLSIEDRAFPLLRPSPTTIPQPKPGFISLIGDTGSGKSWILRSLKRGDDRSRYPHPLVAPGRQSINFDSTSSDVHLYADSATSESANPILFLDFEGLKGTVPSSLKPRLGNAISEVDSNRHDLIQEAYPRIAYAFSNCIIFVVNEQVGKARATAKLLTKYSNCGVMGSRQLGFKPALFIIFNQLPCRDLSPSFWSINKSTEAFLANPEVTDLIDHYHKIFVINIPHLTPKSSSIVLHQLDELQRRLYEQHIEACIRRVAFRLDFTPDQITVYLTHALRVFTKHKNAVFDWLEQSLDQRELPDPTKIAEDKWIHFYRHFRERNLSPIKAFEDAREAFQSHFLFCVRLHLARHPPVGRTVDYIPRIFIDTIREVDQAISHYIPCDGAKDDLQCDRIQQRHDNDFHACDTKRWNGTFKHAVKYEHSLKDRVLQALAADGSQDSPKLSVSHSTSILILSKIRSVYSCVGCLKYPSTSLSCEHGFCEECVEEITGTKDLHRLTTIKCPFCPNTPEGQHFSPRFLPHGAGYRILSLDGGGVRVMAQIRILRAIENRCFDIPIVHLFDFFIGTSIGGQLVLALASRESPLSLSNATTEFRNLVVQGFKPKSTFLPLRAAVTGSTKYSATALETNLKRFFEESRLLSARTPLSPHVAVTAASRISFEKRVIPNYVRPPSENSDKDKRRLVLSAKPEQCMPTWVAARCTSAAYPYFKGFEWNGEYLLDGGFSANCPAELAVEETRCLWPDRRMDSLVSVGTGTTSVSRARDQSSHSGHHADNQSPHSNNHSSHSNSKHPENLLKIAETAIEMVTSSEKLWTEFETHHKSEKDRIIRFQPMYDETFRLDDVNKLDTISKEVEKWLNANTRRIDHASNQLIASLFFFKRSAFDSQSRTQSGTIKCRLPPGLFERQKIVNALIKVAQERQLFTVGIPGGPGEDIGGVLDVLKNLRSGEELTIPVTVNHLPLVGVTLDIKLCNIFGNEESRYSISGCPFTIK